MQHPKDFWIKGKQQETEKARVPVSEEVVNAAGFKRLLIWSSYRQADDLL